MRNSGFLTKAAGIGLAAALAASVSTGAIAAPVNAGNAVTLKEATPSQVVDVRHWRRHRGAWIGAGVAGLALGAALAAPYYYGYGPYYYAPPPPRRCWVPATPWRPGYWTYC